MYTKWIYKNIDNISEEAKKAVNNDLIAKLLTQRGIDSKKRLDDFLKPLKMPIISQEDADEYDNIEEILEKELQVDHLIDMMDHLINDETALNILKDNAKKLGKPQACQDIYQVIIEMLGEKR